MKLRNEGPVGPRIEGVHVYMHVYNGSNWLFPHIRLMNINISLEVVLICYSRSALIDPKPYIVDHCTVVVIFLAHMDL